MVRVVGIDPGTLSIDVCGIIDGQIYVDRSWPTAEATADPAGLVEFLTTPGPPDLVVDPSGYGLPLRRATEATDTSLRLAFLAPPGETGGIGGLRGLAGRHLEQATAPRSVAIEAWAALLADGLAGGAEAALVNRLRIREAGGTVLDHLVFVSPAAARRRLGIEQ